MFTWSGFVVLVMLFSKVTCTDMRIVFGHSKTCNVPGYISCTHALMQCVCVCVHTHEYVMLYSKKK